MPECFGNVQYYGMGKEENLSDLYAQSIIGIYDTTVAEMHEPYIRPQDAGNRCKVRYLTLTDDEATASNSLIRAAISTSMQGITPRSCFRKQSIRRICATSTP